MTTIYINKMLHFENKQSQIFKHTFLQNTSQRLLLKFVQYLFLESFFCFFGSICFAPLQMFNV